MNLEFKIMAYLTSCLTANSSKEESPQILCYYINDTSNIQVIRAIHEGLCTLERVIFLGERILFEAFPESYLEVYSSLINGTRSKIIDCKSLHINGNSTLEMASQTYV